VGCTPLLGVPQRACTKTTCRNFKQKKKKMQETIHQEKDYLVHCYNNNNNNNNNRDTYII